MNQDLSREQLQQGRAIIESCLSPEDLAQLKQLLDEGDVGNLSAEQKAAIRTLFQSFGFL